TLYALLDDEYPRKIPSSALHYKKFSRFRRSFRRILSENSTVMKFPMEFPSDNYPTQISSTENIFRRIAKSDGEFTSDESDGNRIFDDEMGSEFSGGFYPTEILSDD
ncbi:hypothetical protein PIB30_113457, partial [Stylosanthes scabra]|nr:hypothetical protein [Stylosanthes scabra]